MTLVIVVVVAVFVLLAIALALYALRRQPAPSPPPIVEPADDDLSERRARQAQLDEHGSELLERRVELDGRRGTLMGDTAIEDAFEDLERRRQQGDISDEEFEREKIRLLS